MNKVKDIGNPVDMESIVAVAKALFLLGLSGDVIFNRIRRDLDRGLDKEARSHLDFVDVIIDRVQNQKP